MQFTTKIPIENYSFPITYESKIVSFGSCFAENMSEKLEYFKFQSTTNPFGIIFNPVSIEKLVMRIIDKNWFTQKDIFFHNELWHCYEVHSELSHPDKETFLIRLNEIIEDSHNQVAKSSHVIITLGTAWVYRNVELDVIVANCHKVPQKQFTKELLSIEIIEKSLSNIIHAFQKVNPACKFIFTVSPVRHIKDGFVENNLSKAHLIAALHQSFDFRLSTYNYFPSYEVMIDELRDYRFYKEDMLHPSQMAIDYIWQQFATHYISQESASIMERIGNIQKDLAHRSIQPESDQHQKFLQQLELKMHLLQQEFPFIQFSTEFPN